MKSSVKVGTIPLSARTPDQRVKDLGDASYRTPEEMSEDLDKVVNWLRRKGKKDKKYDPTGEVRNIDGLLPVQKSQLLEERVRKGQGRLKVLSIE